MIAATVLARVVATEVVNTASVSSSTDDVGRRRSIVRTDHPVAQTAELGIAKSGLDTTAGKRRPGRSSSPIRDPPTRKRSASPTNCRRRCSTPGCSALRPIASFSAACCSADLHLAERCVRDVDVEGTVDPTYRAGSDGEHRRRRMRRRRDPGGCRTTPPQRSMSATPRTSRWQRADRQLPFPARAIEWTITVHNAGPSEARDVTVADTVPAGVQE